MGFKNYLREIFRNSPKDAVGKSQYLIFWHFNIVITVDTGYIFLERARKSLNE